MSFTKVTLYREVLLGIQHNVNSCRAQRYPSQRRCVVGILSMAWRSQAVQVNKLWDPCPLWPILSGAVRDTQQKGIASRRRGCQALFKWAYFQTRHTHRHIGRVSVIATTRSSSVIDTHAVYRQNHEMVLERSILLTVFSSSDAKSSLAQKHCRIFVIRSWSLDSDNPANSPCRLASAIRNSIIFRFPSLAFCLPS
jgi:hypothetical protein